MSQLFPSGGQNIGVSASTSVLPMNTQDLSPLGWTGWISLQSKGLSRVFSNTTVQKHQFFIGPCFYHQSHPQLGVVFALVSSPHSFGVISPLISSSILGTYQPVEFIFQCPIFLPVHTVHGVLKTRILKWFAIPFSSGPHFVT